MGHAGELDLKIRRKIRVDVALHDAAGEAQHADDAVMEAVVVGEAVGADEDEGLVAAEIRVGVDGLEIDVILLGVMEVGNHIAVGADRAVAESEGKVIGAETAGEYVLARV